MKIARRKIRLKSVNQKSEQSFESDKEPDTPYDRRKLSYANTFTNPIQRNTIKTLELLTGKLRLLRKVRQFEKMGIPVGQPFWGQALDLLGINLITKQSEIAKIPNKGSLVITANHPHGLVDGMVLAELIGKVRTDYKILTRSLLTGVKQIDQFMIPVPFDHEENALKKSLVALRLVLKLNARLVLVFGCGGERDKGKRKIMGTVAEKFADIVFITDDNPRNEDPASIRNEIAAYCKKSINVNGRKKAITKAISIMKKNDILLIAGKGHEKTQEIKGKVSLFDDEIVAKEYFDKRFSL